MRHASGDPPGVLYPLHSLLLVQCCVWTATCSAVFFISYVLSLIQFVNSTQYCTFNVHPNTFQAVASYREEEDHLYFLLSYNATLLPTDKVQLVLNDRTIPMQPVHDSKFT